MAFQPRDSLHRSELDLFIWKIGVVVVAAIALALLWAARDVLILVFIAAVLAAGISPVIHRVRVWGRLLFHKHIPRGTAVLIVYLPFLVLALGLLIFMVPRLVDDTRALSAQLPVMIEKNVFTPLERYVPMNAAREFLRGGIVLPRASVLFYVRSAATAIASFIAVLFMIGYMLVDVQRLRNMILLIYPPELRAQRRALMTRMSRRMSAWLSAQLTLALIIGVATFIGLMLLRVPYALPLSIFASFGEMVPVIGPILGTAPALAIALLQSRWQFWSVLAMILLLQKSENLFIAPRIMSRKVQISPLAVFIAFMVGGRLLGIVGAIIAIPAAVILQVAFDEAFVARRERRQDIARAGTLTARRR
jgi:predicted PurR-regulated permease PerM